MKKRRIISIVMFLVVIFALIVPASAINTSTYSTIITNDPNGETATGTNIDTELYYSYSDFTIWVYPTNFPLYIQEEGENRMWSVYSQTTLPRLVQFGSSRIDDIGVTMPSNTFGQTVEYYNTVAGTEVTQIQTTATSYQSTSYNRRVWYTIAPSIGAYGDIAYYLSGSSFYNKRVLTNGNYIEESFTISLPSSGAYTVDIEGEFYGINNGITYVMPVEHFATYLPTDDEREDIMLTPSYLGAQTATGINEFTQGVFVGDIYVTAYSSETVYPSFINFFSDDYKTQIMVTDSDITSHSLRQNDPLLAFNYSGLNIDYGTLYVNENGVYNVDDYMLVNVQVPSTIAWSGLFDWIFDSIGAFMSFEIAPDWSIGTIMSIVVSLSVGIWLIRVFMGG